MYVNIVVEFGIPSTTYPLIYLFRQESIEHVLWDTIFFLCLRFTATYTVYNKYIQVML